MIHIVKGFNVVSEAEVDIFLEFSRFFYDPTDVGLSKKQESSRKTSTSASLTTLNPLTVWITTNWKIFKVMAIPDHLTCLLRNLYAGQEPTVRTRHETMD